MLKSFTKCTVKSIYNFMPRMPNLVGRLQFPLPFSLPYLIMPPGLLSKRTMSDG